MLAYTYRKQGEFALQNKPEPVLTHAGDAVVRVTMSSICTSDLHIKHGSVPRAVPGITVGHEMVGVVEQVGSAVKTVKPGDRVAVNVETFCGHCFFCQHGFVTTAPIPTAAGHSAAGLTAVRRSTSACRTPLRSHSAGKYA